MSEDSPTIVSCAGPKDQINDVIKNIGYIALCISILLFLIIKILKYLLARRAMALQQQKFRLLEPYGSKLNMSLSQLSTPISKSPLNRLSEPYSSRSFTP